MHKESLYHLSPEFFSYYHLYGQVYSLGSLQNARLEEIFQNGLQNPRVFAI